MPDWAVSNCDFLLSQQKVKDGNQWAQSQGGRQHRNNNNTEGNAKKKKKKKNRAARRNKYMKKLIHKSVWKHEPPTKDQWSRHRGEAEERRFLTGNVEKSLKYSHCSTFSQYIYYVQTYLCVC